MREIKVVREGGFINVTIKKSEKKKISFFAKGVKGSLRWPTIHSPGYLCVVAQKVGINAYGKSPLFLLEEHTERLSKDLFKVLIDSRKRFSCVQFYNDFKPENEGLKRLFYDHCRYERASGIGLIRAPLVENFNLRMDLVREWVKSESLEVPDGTILCDQLEHMSPDDLSEKPEERFFAVDALSFILASLEKDGSWQPDEFIDVEGGRRREREKADSVGWT